MLKYGQKRRMTQLIRETIDNLPGGICLSTLSGRPVLTNRQMNDLVFKLTGHTVMNGRTLWDELRQIKSANGCEKLEEPRLGFADADEINDTLLFRFRNERVWRFCRRELTDRQPHYVQLEASDVSDLYRYSQKLYETNQRLAGQHVRQRNLLVNIVQVNHEKEILRAKMRIHDDLGRSIITTKQYLLRGTIEENAPQLAEIWDNTIRKLLDFANINVETESSPETELLRAADMIGCRICFYGERPARRKTSLLFYMAVREALTNAVRHGGADRLDVSVCQIDNGYHVEISDNGKISVAEVSEGSGLSNLRRKLEQEGAVLHVQCENSVTLVIELPEESQAAPY